jgi:pimeloyl-ACP methyl ester carboxylesterase
MNTRQHFPLTAFQRRLPLAGLLLILLTGQSVSAAGSDALRVTDYFLSHVSKEPFYRDQGQNPTVNLHVREVVKAGNERTAAQENKVLLFLHGATFPGYVAFDLDHENISMMRHFARLGWDTFALDLEGYGQSTRPAVMDSPNQYPDRQAPISLEVTLADVERTVDFIRHLRGVDKVHLLGWSAGAMVEGPRFAIRHPDKVAKLVLYGAKYLGKGKSAEQRRKQDAKRNAEKNRYGNPGDVTRWAKLGTREQNLIPGAFEAYTVAHRASDPMSKALDGRIRAPWGRFIGWPEPHFDAAAITVPTLVIRGETDAVASREDNQELFQALGTENKKYVEIEGAGHMMHFEKVNERFYEFLEAFLND